MSQVFTASQYAAALGVSPQRIRQILEDAPSSLARSVMINGQLATAWPVEALPESALADLERKRRDGRFLNLEHLISDPAKAWRPPAPLGDIAPHCLEAAHARQKMMAPILSAHSQKRTGAIVALAQSVCGPAYSARTLRRWIDRAKERDGGRGEWQRVDLYLDEQVQTKPRPQEATRCELIERAINQVKNKASLSRQEAEAIWSAALDEYILRRVNGHEPREIRSAIIRALSGCGVCRSPKALRKKVERIVLKWEEAGGKKEALQDRRRGNTGRPPLVDPSPTEIARLQRLRIQTGSASLAVRMFENDPDCTEAMRAAIQRPRTSKHSIPPSIRRALAVTAEAEAYDKGPRAYDSIAFTTNRDGTHILENGTRPKIEPGDWWVFDDMSLNHPFWFEQEPGADALSKRHGVSLGRQALFSGDLSSGKWLGAELIGRERDAYRAEDILRFFRRLFAEYGLPRFGIILERGVWRSKSITGQMARDEEGERLVCGVQELGITIKTCWSPKQKGTIETAFGFLQKAASTINAPSYGRFRGERERECKAIQRARSGVVHPKELGVPHIDAMKDLYRGVMVFCNSEQKEGRIQRGVPDERWQRATAAKPLNALCDDKNHLLMPDKRPLQIRSGCVRPKVDGVELAFSNPEIFATLGSGYNVIVCFDPTEPSAGAYILNNESGHKSQGQGRAGDFICHAELLEDAPQFCASKGYHNDGIEKRKVYNRAFRTAYVSTGLFGKNTRTAMEHRNGRGNVLRLELGGTVHSKSDGSANVAKKEGIELLLAARGESRNEEEELRGLEAQEEMLRIEQPWNFQ